MARCQHDDRSQNELPGLGTSKGSLDLPAAGTAGEGSWKAPGFLGQYVDIGQYGRYIGQYGQTSHIINIQPIPAALPAWMGPAESIPLFWVFILPKEPLGNGAGLLRLSITH